MRKIRRIKKKHLERQGPVSRVEELGEDIEVEFRVFRARYRVEVAGKRMTVDRILLQDMDVTNGQPAGIIYIEYPKSEKFYLFTEEEHVRWLADEGGKEVLELHLE